MKIRHASMNWWIWCTGLASAFCCVSAAHGAAWIVGGGLQAYWSDPQTPDAHKTRAVLSLEHSLGSEYSIRLSGGRWKQTWGGPGDTDEIVPVLTASDYSAGLAIVRRVPATRTFSAALAFGLVQHWTLQEADYLGSVSRVALAPLQPEVQLEAQKIVFGNLGLFVNCGENLQSPLSSHDSSAAFLGAGVRFVPR